MHFASLKWGSKLPCVSIVFTRSATTERYESQSSSGENQTNTSVPALVSDRIVFEFGFPGLMTNYRSH